VKAETDLAQTNLGFGFCKSAHRALSILASLTNVACCLAGTFCSPVSHTCNPQRTAQYYLHMQLLLCKGREPGLSAIAL